MNIHQGQHDEQMPRMLTREQGPQLGQIYYTLFTEKPTYFLWIIGSWLIILLNLIATSIAVRDMWTNNYAAGTHWLSSAVLVATIGGLMIIHEYVIRKKNNGT